MPAWDTTDTSILWVAGETMGKTPSGVPTPIPTDADLSDQVTISGAILLVHSMAVRLVASGVLPDTSGF
jgi:hypothetical protein